jgi:uncharacterized protein (TIGR03000 family)
MIRVQVIRVANTILAALAAGPALAAPPPGYSAGPNPIFGSPGAYGPAQYSYPAPGVYGSTVFAPNRVPSLSTGWPPYDVPLSTEYPAVATAKVNVRLPADAKLWVDGKPTKQTGPIRSFVTPPVLRAGLTYQYSFRAEWTRDGQTVTRERTVPVKATGSFDVDFNTP